MKPEHEISEDEMRTLVQSEDPDEIAEIVDRIVAEVSDVNVYKGFNENYGFYIA